MAMRYAYHAKKNVYIGMIVYGKVHGKTQNADADIYDMTSLFYMDELSEQFCKMNIDNPEERISKLILGSEGEDDE